MSMKNITYDMIERFIVHTERQGNRMYCEFENQNGELFSAEGTIKRVRNVQSNIQRNVKRIVVNQARRNASRVVRRMLGGGMLGRTGSMVFRQASRPENIGINYSNAEKRAAVVSAFISVASSFDLSGIGIEEKTTSSGRSINPIKKEEEPKKKRSARSKDVSAFEAQLQKHPVQNPFEQEVMARILVEIAESDGQIGNEEREFLQDFIPESLGMIDDILQMDPVSTVECEEISPHVNESIYMIAWVLSLVDFDLDTSEESILTEYAELLSISDQRLQEITMDAKYYVLEQAIDPRTPRDEVIELGSQIGLTSDESERCLVRVKKRG